jgi:hypothetical protein
MKEMEEGEEGVEEGVIHDVKELINDLFCKCTEDKDEGEEEEEKGGEEVEFVEWTGGRRRRRRELAQQKRVSSMKWS